MQYRVFKRLGVVGHWTRWRLAGGATDRPAAAALADMVRSEVGAGAVIVIEPVYVPPPRWSAA